MTGKQVAEHGFKHTLQDVEQLGHQAVHGAQKAMHEADEKLHATYKSALDGLDGFMAGLRGIGKVKDVKPGDAGYYAVAPHSKSGLGR